MKRSILAACEATGKRALPSWLGTCAATHKRVLKELLVTSLTELLDGIRRNTDEDQRWNRVAERIASALKGSKCKIEAAILSPSKRHLAACAESKAFLGLRVSYVGAIYDLADNAIVGRVPEGKRSGGHWAAR